MTIRIFFCMQANSCDLNNIDLFTHFVFLFILLPIESYFYSHKSFHTIMAISLDDVVIILRKETL